MTYLLMPPLMLPPAEACISSHLPPNTSNQSAKCQNSFSVSRLTPKSWLSPHLPKNEKNVQQHLTSQHFYWDSTRNFHRTRRPPAFPEHQSSSMWQPFDLGALALLGFLHVLPHLVAPRSLKTRCSLSLGPFGVGCDVTDVPLTPQP